ncbi:hypothetical protein C8F04DRAFT_1055386, partial [Mycena alexandri]
MYSCSATPNFRSCRQNQRLRTSFTYSGRLRAFGTFHLAKVICISFLIRSESFAFHLSIFTFHCVCARSSQLGAQAKGMKSRSRDVAKVAYQTSGISAPFNVEGFGGGAKGWDSFCFRGASTFHFKTSPNLKQVPLILLPVTVATCGGIATLNGGGKAFVINSGDSLSVFCSHPYGLVVAPSLSPLEAGFHRGSRQSFSVICEPAAISLSPIDALLRNHLLPLA